MPEQLSDSSETLALSPVQTRVVVAVAQGDSVSAAAETAGVHRRTIHRWLHEPAFEAAVKQARDDYIETLSDQFKALTGLALTKLRVLLESPQTPPGVVSRVALAILNRRHFPHRSWELDAIDDSDGFWDCHAEEENEESADFSLEDGVTTGTLRDNS